MNKKHYDAARASEKQWETKNVIDIEITYVIGAGDATAQVRQAGLQDSHVSELMDSIAQQGQLVPVTVEDVGKRPDGTTQYRLVDGEHRYRAISKLAKHNPENMLWQSIRAVVKGFASEWERLEYQSLSNSHGVPAMSNATSDAQLMLSHVIDGNIPGLPSSLKKLASSRSRYAATPKEYMKELIGALKYLYPDMSAKRRNAAASGFVKNIPGKLRNYGAEIVKEEFDQWAHNVNLVLPKSVSLHTLKNTNYIDWQLVARLFVAKDDSNNANENITIFYWKETQGKDHDQLDDHRVNMIARLNKRNCSPLLKKGRRLTERLFIAPQKQSSSNDEHGFYEIVMDNNGNFPTQVPTNGWDTTQNIAAAAK
tara:strand:- start:361 stop:1464 length:1104 start_codon:yes stop_codon:yes gene_type:complete